MRAASGRAVQHRPIARYGAASTCVTLVPVFRGPTSENGGGGTDSNRSPSAKWPCQGKLFQRDQRTLGLR